MSLSFIWSACGATVSLGLESSEVCLLRSEKSCRFVVSSRESTGACSVVSVVILGDVSKSPVSALCSATLGASADNSEDSLAGLEGKCAIPWLGGDRSVRFGDLLGGGEGGGVLDGDACEGLVIGLTLGTPDTEMGTRLGFVSAFPPPESSISGRVRGCLKLVWSKVLVRSSSGLGECSVLWRQVGPDAVGVMSGCCFIGAVIPTGNIVSKSGKALVSEGDWDAAAAAVTAATHSVAPGAGVVCSIKMATAAQSSFELRVGVRRAAAALIVSMATGSRARGVASLGVEAWLVSVS